METPRKIIPLEDCVINGIWPKDNMWTFTLRYPSSEDIIYYLVRVLKIAFHCIREPRVKKMLMIEWKNWIRQKYLTKEFVLIVLSKAFCQFEEIISDKRESKTIDFNEEELSENPALTGSKTLPQSLMAYPVEHSKKESQRCWLQSQPPKLCSSMKRFKHILKSARSVFPLKFCFTVL